MCERERESYACVCVCVWRAHFFETAAVSNFALYLCNFLLRKTVVACSLPILCVPSPPHTTFGCCKLATTCCSCNSVCPIANENVRQLRHLLYAWTIMHLHMNACACACVCVCQSMCVGMWVCGCECVPACVCLQSQQLPIGSKISQLQSHAPQNDDKWVRFSFASVSSPLPPQLQLHFRL